MFRRKRGARTSSSNTPFNPDDARHVKHSRIGVWDIYEEKEPNFARIPGSSERLQAYYEMTSSLPYVWRMIKDISTINDCFALIALYILVEIIASLIPAVALW